mmetsp:Transcript_110708/g.236463  ORF Transcript_110708/g.236463 Transcript_110708/m.236463 type:complete len:291 (+) Transcript_110708:91-963(+)
MSVTGFMYNINATKKLGDIEIAEGYEGNRSWHHQFRHSAYIYIGGLHPGLTEGDVAIVFSQFGEIVDVHMVRDKATGKSKGFAFICYEDQRSTILAVDNLNGFQLLKRTLRVDHCEKYKAPKDLDEDDLDENGDPKLKEYKASGAEGGGHGVYNVTKGQAKLAEVEGQKRKLEAPQTKEDDDEAWARAFEESLKSGGDLGLGKVKKEKKSLKQDKAEIKQMKKEAKALKKEVRQLKKKKKAKRAKNAKGGKKVKSEEESSPSSGSPSSDSDDSDDSSSAGGAGKPSKRRR